MRAACAPRESIRRGFILASAAMCRGPENTTVIRIERSAPRRGEMTGSVADRMQHVVAPRFGIAAALDITQGVAVATATREAGG